MFNKLDMELKLLKTQKEKMLEKLAKAESSYEEGFFEGTVEMQEYIIEMLEGLYE